MCRIPIPMPCICRPFVEVALFCTETLCCKFWEEEVILLEDPDIFFRQETDKKINRQKEKIPTIKPKDDDV